MNYVSDNNDRNHVNITCLFSQKGRRLSLALSHSRRWCCEFRLAQVRESLTFKKLQTFQYQGKLQRSKLAHNIKLLFLEAQNSVRNVYFAA